MHIHTQDQFCIDKAPGRFLGSGRKPENERENPNRLGKCT